MRSIFVAVGVFIAASAVAKEVRVAEHEVPRLALDAVTKKHPTAKKIGFEKETEGDKVSYEVKIVDGARHIDVDVSADGKITAEEEMLTPSELPSPVRDALAHSPKYGKWSVKRVERVIQDEKGEAPTYEIVVAHDSAKAELVFAPDGKLLTTEAR
jgi:hypothetical protein